MLLKFEQPFAETVFHCLQRGHRPDQEVVGRQHGASIRGLEEPRAPVADDLLPRHVEEP